MIRMFTRVVRLGSVFSKQISRPVHEYNIVITFGRRVLFQTVVLRLTSSTLQFVSFDGILFLDLINNINNNNRRRYFRLSAPKHYIRSNETVRFPYNFGYALATSHHPADRWRSRVPSNTSTTG